MIVSGESFTKKILTPALLAASLFIFAGCGAPEEEQPEEQVDYEIAMVTDAGMIMDGGYNEVTWDAISEFGEKNGVSHKYYKAAEASDEAYKEAIDDAASRGAKMLIADGYSFEEVVYEAQKEYKDIDFVLIDAEPSNAESGKTKIADNTESIMFASEQAGYLAGYAAVADGKTALGFIGETERPAVIDYGYGFLQGAEAAARESGARVSVRYHYCASEEDRDAVCDKAGQWYKGGTEVIFACGSGVEQPVIEAAELNEKKVIGSDTDKSDMSDTVMTSALKDIDGAIDAVLEEYDDDEFGGGSITAYNAENEGIGLEMENGRFDVFTEQQYETALEGLASGSTVVKKHDIGAVSKLGLVYVKVTEE